MPTFNLCARCGAGLHPQQAEGLCTRCLLESGLEESEVEPNVAAPGQIQAPLREGGPSLAQTFGDYELIEEIARGGMGVVCRARQRSLGRIVALKLILAGQFASKQTIQRFRGEVTAAALLQHPNIVAIHDVGIHDGQHYFSMDHVERQNFAQLVGHRPLSPAKAAHYLKLVAEAIHYAHQQGILHRDLETICLKCLEKEPAKRYQRAQELADELDRFLRHEPIHARPITRAERWWRWCRRKPTLAGLVVALHLVFALGLLGVFWQWRRAAVGESLTRRNLYTSDMNRIHQAWEDGNLQLAQALLRAHAPQAGQEDLRGFEWRYLWKLCRDESRVTFTNVHFAGERRGLALAADGRTVIAASGDTLAWLDWQNPRDEQCKTVGAQAITELSMAVEQPGLVAYHTDRLNALSSAGQALWGAGLAPEIGALTPSWGAFALSRDGTLLAASVPDSKILIIDVKTGQQIGPDFDLGTEEIPLVLAFSPDGKYLAYGSTTTRIHILEAPRFSRVNLLTNHTAFVTCLAFNRMGSKLVSGSNDSHIRVWNFPDCVPVADLAGHQGWIGDLAAAPDGQRFASGGSDHTVRLWHLANPGAPTFLHGHLGTVRSVLFSRDGNQLFTGSDDRTVKVWDVSAHASTNRLQHSGYTSDVAFSPDGTRVAVADYAAHTAVLWELPSQQPIGRLGQYPGACMGVRFSPDGSLLATVGADETVQLEHVSSGKTIFVRPTAVGSDSHISGDSLAFHPRQPILAVGCVDLRFWNVQDGTRTNLLPHAPSADVQSLVFSPNGEWLALGMRNGEVSILELATARLQSRFQEHSAAVHVLCVSRDGRFLASGGDDKRIVLYDVRRPGTTVRMEGHRGRVSGLAFAPDGNTLVSTSEDGTIRFWTLTNQQVSVTLTHDGAPVTSVAFSPDGNLMATSGADGTARMWAAASWEEVRASETAKAKHK